MSNKPSEFWPNMHSCVSLACVNEHCSMVLFEYIHNAFSVTFKLFTCYYRSDFIQKYAKNKNKCVFIAV